MGGLFSPPGVALGSFPQAATRAALRANPCRFSGTTSSRVVNLPLLATEPISAKPEPNFAKPLKRERNGALDRIRTCDLCLRRAALYPAELRVRAWNRGGPIKKTGPPCKADPASFGKIDASGLVVQDWAWFPASAGRCFRQMGRGRCWGPCPGTRRFPGYVPGVNAALSWSTLIGWPWPPPVQDETSPPRPEPFNCSSTPDSPPREEPCSTLFQHALGAALGASQYCALHGADRVIQKTHATLLQQVKDNITSKSRRPCDRSRCPCGPCR